MARSVTTRPTKSGVVQGDLNLCGMQNSCPWKIEAAQNDRGEPSAVVVVSGRERQARIKYARVREYPGSCDNGDSRHVRIIPFIFAFTAQLPFRRRHLNGAAHCHALSRLANFDQGSGTCANSFKYLSSFAQIPRNSTLRPLGLSAARPSIARQRPGLLKQALGMVRTLLGWPLRASNIIQVSKRRKQGLSKRRQEKTLSNALFNAGQFSVRLSFILHTSSRNGSSYSTGGVGVDSSVIS